MARGAAMPSGRGAVVNAPSQSWLSDASFISTLQPSALQRRFALAVAVVSLGVFLLASPYARHPLAPMPAFLPFYESALAVFDLITGILLLSQYAMLRSRALQLLAAGYIFSTVMAMAHALSFPGLFAPAGVIGGGPQTTAWIYFLWHAGFCVFVIGYARARRRPSLPIGGPALRDGVRASLALGLVASFAVVLATTLLHDLLPPVMNGNTDAPGKIVVAASTWVLGLVALATIWRTRTHTVLDMWLMVVMCVWAADTALASVLNGGRFDLGWYAGRIYGLLASGFVLTVLLVETGALYSRLARAMGELQLAHRDLQAFSGTLAHDMQQPITTIASFAQVIQRHADRIPTEDVSHLQKIIGAADTSRRMIRALLDFARLGETPVHKAAVDLNVVVAEARNAVANGQSDAPIEWNIGELPTVQADAALLLLAFINLLSNAVKYTRGRDRRVITVTARLLPGNSCAIEVRDNGVGFDMNHAARLFTPFQRLHGAHEFEGTGMGLANVRRIVEKHGGSVSAQAEVGRGATFTLVLA